MSITLDVLKKAAAWKNPSIPSEAAIVSTTRTQDGLDQKPKKTWQDKLREGYNKNYENSIPAKIDRWFEKKGIFGSQKWKKGHPGWTGFLEQHGAPYFGLTYKDLSEINAKGQRTNVWENEEDRKKYDRGRMASAVFNRLKDIGVAFGMAKSGAQAAKQDMSTRMATELVEGMAKNAGYTPHRFPRGMFDNPVMAPWKKQAVRLLSDYYFSGKPVVKAPKLLEGEYDPSKWRGKMSLENVAGKKYVERMKTGAKNYQKALQNIDSEDYNDLMAFGINAQYFDPNQEVEFVDLKGFKKEVDNSDLGLLAEGFSEEQVDAQREDLKADVEAKFGDERAKAMGLTIGNKILLKIPTLDEMNQESFKKRWGLRGDVTAQGRINFIDMLLKHEPIHIRQKDAQKQNLHDYTKAHHWEDLWSKFFEETGQFEDEIFKRSAAKELGENANRRHRGFEARRYYSNPKEITPRLSALTEIYNDLGVPINSENLLNPPRRVLDAVLDNNDAGDGLYMLYQSKELREQYLRVLKDLVYKQPKKKEMYA